MAVKSFLIRTDSELFHQLRVLAALEGMSMNKYINKILEEKADQKELKELIKK